MNSAGRLFSNGVGGQTFMGSTVTPFARQTTDGLNMLEGNARSAAPVMRQRGEDMLNYVRDARGSDPSMLNAQHNMAAVNDGQANVPTSRIDGIGDQATNNPFTSDFSSLSRDARADPFSGAYGRLASDAQNNPFTSRVANLADTAGNNPALQGFGQMSGAQGPSFSQNNLSNVAQGKLLGGGDPYFEEALANASKRASEAVNLSASGAGRYGSGMHQGAIAREVGDLQTQARSNQYNAERARQVEANSLIDQQRNIGDQTRLSALGGLGSTYATGQGQQLNAALGGGNLHQGNIAGALAANQAGTGAYYGGIDRSLSAVNSGANSRQNDMSTALNAYLGSAGIQGGNVDRRMQAGNNLFQMGQQGVNNQLSAFDRLGTQYGYGNMPADTLRSVGSAYEGLNRETVDDQLRIFDSLQNQPWNQLARYNGIASGTGSLGGTTTSRQNQGLGGVLGGLLGLAGMA